MPVRRPIRNINDPMLQEALAINAQRNPNAAIKGMLGRNIYGAYGAREGAREIAGRAFGERMSLAKRRRADSARQHGMSYALKRKSLRDAKKGARIAGIIGLGQLGLGAWGSLDARRGRKKDKAFREQLQEMILQGKINPYAASYGMKGMT